MVAYLCILLLCAGHAAWVQPDSIPHALSGMVVYSAKVQLFARGNSTDTLRFNQERSFFQWQRHTNDSRNSTYLKKFKRLHPNEKMETLSHASPQDSIGDYTLYDTASDSLFSRYVMPALGHTYALKAKRPSIHWSITDSTKKIGRSSCTEAAAHFWGRDYTARFTPKIPVPYGPWKLTTL